MGLLVYAVLFGVFCYNADFRVAAPSPHSSARALLPVLLPVLVTVSPWPCSRAPCGGWW